ncbi:MAG TPA: Sir2 family NAD-dependent protein deacetylase, partial [Thauera sp.]|nr:Sir2 family NAD-dependent protein deacetylase [Thauera sp.]
MSSHEDALDAVAGCLAEAQRVLFITGAGISADSGLPTYRGIGGLYHERLTEDGLSIEQALSGQMM